MENPQYIEYLNTFGAEIYLKHQPHKELDALLKERTAKEKGLKTLGRLLKKVIYHIRYKYYQCCDLVKKFTLDDSEIERTRIINSIERLKNKK